MKTDNRGLLPLPPFFDPGHAESWDYAPDPAQLLSAAQAWRDDFRVAPAGMDALTTLLLVIDAQRDFCHPKGSLFVGGRSGRGAIDDCARLCAFIYRCANQLTAVDCTLDTHLPHQIFFSTFWQDAHGNPVDAHREVSAEQVRAGDLEPRPELVATLGLPSYDWLRQQAIDYCERLESRGRYQLYLWPLHCLLGGDGHALHGIVQEARLFHSFLRTSPGHLEAKGDNPLTENYSVLAPEVLIRHDGLPLAQRNDRYLERLLSFDRLIIAGQAASHCVRFTLDDLIEQLATHRPDMLDRITLLEDCMSAVAVPDNNGDGFAVDFTDSAEGALDRYRELGIRVVRSTEVKGL